MEQASRTIGDIFRQKREEMNLSLKEIENATSIRETYLKAIEENKTQTMLSPVYVSGFVRQYAAFLGIDGDKIIEENPQIFQRKAEQQEFSYGIGTLETRGAPKGSNKFFPNLLWGALGIGVLALAWYFAKFLEIV